MNAIGRDLAAALDRRASDVVVVDGLEAILDDRELIRPTTPRSPRRRSGLLAVASATLLVIGGAGLVWAARSGDATLPASATANPDTSLSSPLALGPNVLADLERRATELGYTEQAAVLAQGYVSEGDLLTAVDNARRCVTGHGFEVGPITRDSRGSMSYVFTLPEGADTPENLALADECQYRYSVLVEQAFDRLNPSNSQAVVARVIECVQRNPDETAFPFDTFRDLQTAVDAAPGSALESCYLSVLSEQTLITE
jgi:hypothetical protein